MPRINEIDRKVLEAMSGEDRLRALIRGAGFDTIRELARALHAFPPEVSMCLNRHREYPEIRDAIAEELDLTREQVDQMIPWPPEAVAQAS